MKFCICQELSAFPRCVSAVLYVHVRVCVYMCVCVCVYMCRHVPAQIMNTAATDLSSSHHPAAPVNLHFPSFSCVQQQCPLLVAEQHHTVFVNLSLSYAEVKAKVQAASRGFVARQDKGHSPSHPLLCTDEFIFH